MPTPLNPVVKRALIITLLCLTGLATLGTVACIAGGRGYGAVEMGLMIGLGLGFLLILCFAAFTAIEHRFLRFPAFAGMTLSALLMLSLPIFAWLLEHRSYYYSSTAPSSIDYYELSGRCIFSAFTLAGLLCIVPWVLVTKFQSFFPRLIQIATAACLLLLFCFWHPVIWAAPLAGSYESEQLFYTLIALSVAGLLATALLKKFCAIRILRPVTYSEITLEIKCPCCHNTGQFPHGPSACPHCALKFNVEIEEPVCPGCGYNLHNLTTPRCPECGRNLPGIVPPVAQAHPVTA